MIARSSPKRLTFLPRGQAGSDVLLRPSIARQNFRMTDHDHAFAKQTTDRRIPTVSRIVGDTIIELVYDPDQQRTGLVVSRFGGLWNIEQEFHTPTGDILVPYSPRNNLIATECVLLPSKPEHHGDKAEILADVTAFLHRYVALSPLFEQLAAHYVLLSWVYDAFNEIPYLRLVGTFGVGKTRAIVAIGSLCYKPFFASGASTVSPIFHIQDHFGGTLVLDEADLPFSDAKNELVKIYNSGAMRGLPVLRTMQNRDKEFNPRAFRVFGPKIIAMRGSFDDPALESRFFTEHMDRRSLRPDIPITLPPSFRTEALALRNKLLHFRLCHFFEVKPDTQRRIEGVTPRMSQMANPLLTLISDQGLVEKISALLRAQSTQAETKRVASPEARVLLALYEAFRGTGGAAASVGAITDRFNEAQSSEYSHPVSSKWVGNVIRRRLRLMTVKSNGIYVVPSSEVPKLGALAMSFGINLDGAHHEIHSDVA